MSRETTLAPERFYPGHISEVFNRRYQVVGKLGYGSSATAWLCRDLMGNRYKTLKLYTTHAGLSCLRPLLDVFHVHSPDARSVHACPAHPPLGLSLDQLTPLLPDGVMSSGMVRTAKRNVLAALDFPHAEARVIHTGSYCLHRESIAITGSGGVDIQPNNILLGIKDESVLSGFEESEIETPVPRRFCKTMHAVLGSPPVEFLARGERSLEFWHQDGTWKGAVPLPEYTLETLEERLQGDEKTDFLRFLRRMLCWAPEERATAKELSFDPWFMRGLFK
ncbi:kinase-like protein [Aspergillus terreus]|uniref:non-specific serine/threonine protein kinase n=1 Tax=Aspergillus terreus TaxID=33178 RepID=A0A5M3YLQ6_ASPTE|nr:hypothetical protein ATETN484_0001049200 [Aspergillus terreus]GFF12348.1 kinase-like protein [Aspergillus terreus]